MFLALQWEVSAVRVLKGCTSIWFMAGSRRGLEARSSSICVFLVRMIRKMHDARVDRCEEAWVLFYLSPSLSLDLAVAAMRSGSDLQLTCFSP